MSRNVGAIAVGNIASKVVGLLREVAFAGWFGTGEAATAFRIAQTTYLLPIQAFIGDSLSAGLLPLYRGQQQGDGVGARVLLFVAAIYGLVISLAVSTLLYVFADNAAALVAPGSPTSVIKLSAALLKIMALATPFFVLSGMLGYIEAAHGRYGAIAWRPILLNVGSIGGAAGAVWFRHDEWMAIGILISHVALFAWTLVQLRKLTRIWPERLPAKEAMRAMSDRLLRHLLPLIGLPLVAQINVLAERVVSSHIGNGVIPSVDYARFVCDTMVQVIAMPLGVMTMSRLGGSSGQEMRSHVLSVSRTVLLLAFPIAVSTALSAEEIVRFLFARGHFNEQSVAMTTSVLIWMGGALGMTISGYYLIKVLNAELRNREALLITLAAVVANMLVNLLLWRWLGVRTAGVGVAVYSATLFLLCLVRLRLWKDLSPAIAWVLAGCILQAGLSLWLAGGLRYPSRLVANGAIAVAIWVLLVVRVPVLREAASPVLSRMPFLKRV